MENRPFPTLSVIRDRSEFWHWYNTFFGIEIEGAYAIQRYWASA